jgi:hypothetical protein
LPPVTFMSFALQPPSAPRVLCDEFHFTLLLSSRGTPKRKCRVIWRKEHQIGVEFDRRLAQHDQVIKKPAADNSAAEAVKTEPEQAEPAKVEPETVEIA